MAIARLAISVMTNPEMVPRDAVLHRSLSQVHNVTFALLTLLVTHDVPRVVVQSRDIIVVPPATNS